MAQPVEVKPRVLVVDDDGDILELLRLNLEVDYDVVTFYDPIDLMVERALDPLPRAVFIDLMMPGASGFVVLHWLRRHFPEVRRIVMTAIGYTQLEAQELSHAYLEKPSDIQLATLYDAIEAQGPFAPPEDENA